MTTQIFAGSTWARRTLAIILVIVGVPLVVGGAYLALLGGSLYYLPVGTVTVVSGVMVWCGDRRGLSLYGVMILATVAWGIWEAGSDGWALSARLLGPSVLGLGLLIPAIGRGLIHHKTAERWTGWRGFCVGLFAAVLIGVSAAVKLTQAPIEI